MCRIKKKSRALQQALEAQHLNRLEDASRKRRRAMYKARREVEKGKREKERRARSRDRTVRRARGEDPVVPVAESGKGEEEDAATESMSLDGVLRRHLGDLRELVSEKAPVLLDVHMFVELTKKDADMEAVLLLIDQSLPFLDNLELVMESQAELHQVKWDRIPKEVRQQAGKILASMCLAVRDASEE